MIRSYLGFVPRIHPKAFIHDSAEIIGKVVVGERASVWPHCSIRGDVDRIVIGARSNIQDLTTIHTREGKPTIIGAEVTVGHNVVLHGARIGDGCLVGMGAIVLEASIGRRCLIAAGSLVLAGAKFPPESLVMGSPAKARRKLTPAELRHIERGMRSYLRKAREHASTSRVVEPR